MIRINLNINMIFNLFCIKGRYSYNTSLASYSILMN